VLAENVIGEAIVEVAQTAILARSRFVDYHVPHYQDGLIVILDVRGEMMS
jgi:hypothetical protein